MARATKTSVQRRGPNRVMPARSCVKGIPTDRLNLTAKERALLADPDWVTEDEADFIVAQRRQGERGKRASLEEVLRENSLKSKSRTIPYIAASAAKTKKQASED